MAVIISQDGRLFTIETAHTSYQMTVEPHGFLLHLYYGRKTKADLRYLLTYYDRGFSENPYDLGEDRTFSLDALPQEYSCFGTGDFRTNAFIMEDENGTAGCDLRFAGYRVIKGKYSIPGLPAVYAEASGEAAKGTTGEAPGEAAAGTSGETTNEAETLEMVLADKNAGVEVTLRYGVLPASDAIMRSAVIRNIGSGKLFVKKAASLSLDLLSGEYDALHFYGRHGMEHILERTEIKQGTLSYGSRRGASSHQHNPSLIVAERETTEDYGACYGMVLLYSGNFKVEAEKDQYLTTRINMGLQDELFSYPLLPGECLYTPEAAMIYSGSGLTALSQLFHHLIRYHVCRGKWKEIRRPILINNWETTMFHFNGEQLVKIAGQASALGVEMFVLDDGWFGERDSDHAGLGDWQVNEKKLGGTLDSFVKRINGLGMKFGLWIEPEMVNENSRLYREHPDWAFQIPGRKPVRGRDQLVLDFSRTEVVDYIFEALSAVISSANVEYIKMDMNRHLCDIYSAGAACENFGKIMYDYVLGVYDFLERLEERYPDLLIEGCSGGGGRFDAGMLYYTPQIWCSDDTDAIERIKIQHGTSFLYPISAVGSHVTVVPNQQTGRSVDIHTRSVVAMAGSFGYELDLNQLTDAEKEEVKQEICDYRKYQKLIQNGNYYRLHTPGKDTDVAAWNFAAGDQSEALLNIVTLDTHCNAPQRYVKCKGLNPDAVYREEKTGLLTSGSALAGAGIPVPYRPGEYQAFQFHFIRVE